MVPVHPAAYLIVSVLPAASSPVAAASTVQASPSLLHSNYTNSSVASVLILMVSVPPTAASPVAAATGDATGEAITPMANGFLIFQQLHPQ